MIAKGSWLGWAVALLTAVSLAGAEPTGVPVAAAPTETAAPLLDQTADDPGTAARTPGTGVTAGGQLIVPSGPGPFPGPAECGPGCDPSFSFASWLRFRKCCPTQPCELPWSPIGRITCNCPPHKYWYGEVGIAGLIRDAEPSGGPLATLGPGGDVVLAASQALPDFRAAGTVRIGRMFTPVSAIEYAYMGSDTWQADAAVRDDSPNALGGLGNLFSPFGDFGAAPVEDFDYNELVSIRGRSQVESFELNLRHRLCMAPEPMQVSIYAGVRYIEVGEDFWYYSQSQVPLGVGATQWVDVRTGNDMIGGQIGTLLEWHIEPRWWFDTRLAAGFYHNRAFQTTHHIETGDDPGENFLERRAERGTIGAEVALSLVYYFTPRFSTRLGYQFLWLDRVALAAENFETDPLLLREGPAQLDVESTIMYHGPFLGVALAW